MINRFLSSREAVTSLLMLSHLSESRAQHVRQIRQFLLKANIIVITIARAIRHNSICSPCDHKSFAAFSRESSLSSRSTSQRLERESMYQLIDHLSSPASILQEITASQIFNREGFTVRDDRFETRFFGSIWRRDSCSMKHHRARERGFAEIGEKLIARCREFRKRRAIHRRPRYYLAHCAFELCLRSRRILNMAGGAQS